MSNITVYIFDITHLLIIIYLFINYIKSTLELYKGQKLSFMII